MPSPISLDTGFLFAIFSRKDEHHKQAISLAQKFAEREWHTTCFVIHEAYYLLNKQGSIQIATDFLKFAKAKMIVGNLPNEWMLRAIELAEKYNDLKIDLADISLVILAEELQQGDILSVDRRDFSALRWGKERPFNNLFFSAN